MNTKKSTRMHYLQTALLFTSIFAAIPIIDTFGPRSAQAVNPPPTCQNLTAEQSDDKNYYRLTATASAANDTDISGYQFDFGDHESYTFDFDGRSDNNRQQVTVKHTYEKAGTYTVVAKVTSKQNGQLVHTSSPGCTVAVTVAGATELPATGPNAFATLVIAMIVGTMTYVISMYTIRKNAQDIDNNR